MTTRNMVWYPMRLLHYHYGVAQYTEPRIPTRLRRLPLLHHRTLLYADGVSRALEITKCLPRRHYPNTNE